MSTLLYDSDFYRWTVEQVERLRLGRWDGLDIENLAEEIESLDNPKSSELKNRLAILLAHLIKWDLPPMLRGKSWRLTIKEQRIQIKKLIRKNPSLKSYLSEVITDGFELALVWVEKETRLKPKDLPKECPYSVEQI
ncbi:DUF29 domain-containing protein [Pseudanabaena sp. FACHB-1998]|uniref:DUF29 domain-containing protein n=1 Tax=Pseudanabaena sp. FACHB-1998 TaxID=2692858 RepID=UPI0018F00C25|nr:DUF29 domain-containing protein [Pseudanabaena sp. FACHB-1998]